MVKTSPSGGFTDSINAISQNFTFLIRIQRVDGTVFGFTNLDIDVPFNDGSGLVTYRHLPGIDRSSISTSADIAVDNTEFNAFFEGSGFTKEDVRDGLWDFAEVKIFLINYDNISDGALKIRRGFLGEASTSIQFFAEIRGMMQRYVKEIGELTAPLCRADLGDVRCKVDITGEEWTMARDFTTNVRNPFDAGGLTEEIMVLPITPNDRWFEITVAGTTGGSEPSWDTGLGNTTIDNDITFTTRQGRRIDVTVDVVTNQMEFTIVTTTDAPDGFFQGGFIDWTSGLNALGGISRKGIALWTLSTKTILLFQPMPRLIVAGDALTLIVGCDHLRDSDCSGTFDNVYNFRGEPDLPGNDQIFRIPPPPPAG
jgi:hypothetical protein